MNPPAKLAKRTRVLKFYGRDDWTGVNNAKAEV
jgi:hypothetical protein